MPGKMLRPAGEGPALEVGAAASWETHMWS